MIRSITLQSVAVGIGFLAFLAGGTLAAAAGPDSVSLPGDAVYPRKLDGDRRRHALHRKLCRGRHFFESRRAQAQPEIWIKPGDFGTRSILGVVADEKSGTLWACSNDLSALGIPGPSDVKGSWLKGFDLKTGAGKISARFPREEEFLQRYRGRPGRRGLRHEFVPARDFSSSTAAAQKLDVWLSDPQFKPARRGVWESTASPFGADGTLYVNTYSDAKLFPHRHRQRQARHQPRRAVSNRLA